MSRSDNLETIALRFVGTLKGWHSSNGGLYTPGEAQVISFPCSLQEQGFLARPIVRGSYVLRRKISGDIIFLDTRHEEIAFRSLPFTRKCQEAAKKLHWADESNILKVIE